MFSGFARRLTAWYVAAAVSFVFLVLGACAFAGLVVYVHLVQGDIDADAREAEAFSARATAHGDSFTSAAVAFETRMARAGVRLIASRNVPLPVPIPRETSSPLLIKPSATHRTPPSRALRSDGPPSIVMDGRVVQGDLRTLRYDGNRLGFAIGAALGAHLHRVEFVGGELTMLLEPNATGNVALGLFAAIVGLAAIAGVLAWFSGRYLTTQVLRPLIEVTSALQRFAARDFTPQAIAVAGKSDFDQIALAYNAAAAQVAAAFAERELAESQMRQFVADAGHELRTPLTIVLGYIDLLRRKADDGDLRSRRIFTSIAAEGARMRTLIDNLVLLARMEGDDARPSEPFELGPLIDEIVDARRELMPGLRVEHDLAVDATVIGNRDEIHEAVANIVDNAIKYAPGSPIRVAARAAGSGIEIEISDSGPGIHPDDRPGIFDRFYRGATRGEVEGSGLGLAIAKRAVERAGGSLALGASTPAGTTFVIRLRADGVRARSESTSHAS